MNSMLAILLISLFTLAPMQNDETVLPEVNRKVVEFCEQKKGKKVGKGECWDLAAEALNTANANWKPPYNFGRKLNLKSDEVLPGDIIQFERVKIVYPDKSRLESPQHTAIIYKVLGKGKYELAEQNANRKRYVTFSEIDLNYLKSGKYFIYRPE